MEEVFSSIDSRPGKVDASVSFLKMDRWKMAMMTYESALDRFMPHTWYVPWLGPPALDVSLR